MSGYDYVKRRIGYRIIENLAGNNSPIIRPILEVETGSKFWELMVGYW